MSALVHLAAVVAVSPSPSPEVVKQTIVESVPQGTPAVVLQAAQVAAVFAAGLVLSVAHRVAEYLTAKEKGWSGPVNAAVASAYTVGVGLVGATSMGKLGVDASSLVALVLSSGVASIGTFWSYAVRNALSLVNGSAKPAAVELAPAASVEVPAVEPAPAVVAPENVG